MSFKAHLAIICLTAAPMLLALAPVVSAQDMLPPNQSSVAPAGAGLAESSPWRGQPYGCCGQCGNGGHCGHRYGQACGTTCGHCGGKCHGHYGHHLLAGCRAKHDEYYAHRPQLPCPGDYMYQLVETQMLKGRQAQLVFHKFHFQWNQENETWGLTRSGWFRVYDLSRLLPWTPGPIVIHPVGNEAIAANQMQAVRDAFAIYGIENVDLIVGNTLDPSLTGEDAILIYDQRLQGSPFSIQRGRSNLSTRGVPGAPTGNSGGGGSN